MTARLRRAWRLVDLALVALLLGALVAVGLSARGVLADRADEAARADALAAARRLAVSFTSLDYRTYDRDARVWPTAPRGSCAGSSREFRRRPEERASTANRSVTRGHRLDAAVVACRPRLRPGAARRRRRRDEHVRPDTRAARHYRMQLDLRRTAAAGWAPDLTVRRGSSAPVLDRPGPDDRAPGEPAAGSRRAPGAADDARACRPASRHDEPGPAATSRAAGAGLAQAPSSRCWSAALAVGGVLLGAGSATTAPVSAPASEAVAGGTLGLPSSGAVLRPHAPGRRLRGRPGR